MQFFTRSFKIDKFENIYIKIMLLYTEKVNISNIRNIRYDKNLRPLRFDSFN